MNEIQSKLSLTINLLSYLYKKNYLIKSDELAKEFNLSVRTIRRLISELRDLGYDIESVSGAHGGYRLNKSNVILPVRLSDQEKEHWQVIENIIYSSDINNKSEVLKTLNIVSIQSQLEANYIPQIYSTRTLLPEKIAHIDFVHKMLNDAMLTKRRVLIKYSSHSNNNVEWREFRPQQFQIFNNIHYIKGYYSLDSESFRTLRLSRFEDIKLSDKKYSFNENFDKDNNDSAFSQNVYKTYAVKLKIMKANHDLLDYQYGNKQEVIEFENYYILKFELAGDIIIKNLVQSLGVYCELLEPLSIRKTLQEEAKIISDRYKEQL